MNTLPARKVNSLEELNSLKFIIVLYSSGASGEFISYALSQTLDNIGFRNQHWENSSRVKFDDALGRSLNCGSTINPDLLLTRLNTYLSLAQGNKHIIMAHPDKIVLDFIKTYLNKQPIIEITLHKYSSRHFASHASFDKIKRFFVDPKFKPTSSEYDLDNRLFVEWQDLMIDNTKVEFNKICQHLNTQGDYSKFSCMLADYISRNSQYLYDQ